MGGFFGVISKTDCATDLFYGIDYHSHLGTRRGGMAVYNGKSMPHVIHNIENATFRSKFEQDVPRLNGRMGIGCISDKEPQPITLKTGLGLFSITTVGRINNISDIASELISTKGKDFFEMSTGEINQTELVSAIISTESTFEAGIQKVYELIDGSISMLILTERGIYAARDKYGRTPIIIGKGEYGYCLTFESCAMPNLGYEKHYELGAGEVVFVNEDGLEVRKKAEPKNLNICSFLWVYYGFPSSTYEGVNVEQMRNATGMYVAENDNTKADIVAGIPDSGIATAIGYSIKRQLPFLRPFMKYTPTWARSFMPQTQAMRNVVAQKKLIPIPEMINGKDIVYCEDSIVRGTQTRELCNIMYKYGAKSVNMRIACPPVLYNCKFLNFSLSSINDTLAARRAIARIEGAMPENIDRYVDHTTSEYKEMIKLVGEEFGFSTIKFANVNDIVKAIGLPQENICTYCFDGKCKQHCSGCNHK